MSREGFCQTGHRMHGSSRQPDVKVHPPVQQKSLRIGSSTVSLEELVDGTVLLFLSPSLALEREGGRNIRILSMRPAVCCLVAVLSGFFFLENCFPVHRSYFLFLLLGAVIRRKQLTGGLRK